MSELYLKKFSARTDRGELQQIFGFNSVERVTVYDVKATDMEIDGEMMIESLSGKIKVNLEDGEDITGTITGKFNGEFLEIDAQFSENFDEEDAVVEMLNTDNFEFISALQGANISVEESVKPSDMDSILETKSKLSPEERINKRRTRIRNKVINVMKFELKSLKEDGDGWIAKKIMDNEINGDMLIARAIDIAEDYYPESQTLENLKDPENPDRQQIIEYANKRLQSIAKYLVSEYDLPED